MTIPEAVEFLTESISCEEHNDDIRAANKMKLVLQMILKFERKVQVLESYASMLTHQRDMADTFIKEILPNEEE